MTNSSIKTLFCRCLLAALPSQRVRSRTATVNRPNVCFLFPHFSNVCLKLTSHLTETRLLGDVKHLRPFSRERGSEENSRAAPPWEAATEEDRSGRRPTSLSWHRPPRSYPQTHTSSVSAAASQRISLQNRTERPTGGAFLHTNDGSEEPVKGAAPLSSSILDVDQKARLGYPL